jgi:hypothetical protein
VTTIALLFDDYTALIVRAESPLKSMRDVVERLRKDPGALSIGVGPRSAAARTSARWWAESRRRAHSRRALRRLQIRGRGDDRRNVRRGGRWRQAQSRIIRRSSQPAASA